MNTPMQERLQRMSYSELRKIARKSGINGKQKAKDLIASILESAVSADDSFVALEEQIMNSSKENKIKRFEEDRGTPSDTPRRDTYTIDDADSSTAQDNDLVTSSASPALKQPLEDPNKSVTMTRGSEKKSAKKRKVSFVTPIRRSARLSCLTPGFASVKDRPKTPIPSRASSGRKGDKFFAGSLFISNSARKSSEGGRRPSTPMPNPKPKRMKLSSPGLLEVPSVTPVSTPVASDGPSSEQKQLMKSLTPMPVSKLALTPITTVTEEKRCSPRHSAVKPAAPLLDSKQESVSTPAPGSKVTPAKKTPLQLSGLKAKKVTPKSQLKKTPLQSSSLKAKKVTPISQMKKTPMQSSHFKSKKATPNFNQLHQKLFDKMESIDAYSKRKQMNSTKKIREQLKFQDSLKKVPLKKNTKIPKKFGGIPFVPSITSTDNIKTDFGSKAMKFDLTPGKRLPPMKFGKLNDSLILSKKIKGEAKGPKPKPKENTRMQKKIDMRPKRKEITPLQKKVDLKPKRNENTPLQKKVNTPLQKKFDLKASLSKKLTYRPHKGPLKPLTPVNLNASIFTSAPAEPMKKAVPENRVIKAKRTEMRGVLHGVRKNKRFELQMKNRK